MIENKFTHIDERPDQVDAFCLSVRPALQVIQGGAKLVVIRRPRKCGQEQLLDKLLVASLRSDKLAQAARLDLVEQGLVGHQEECLRERRRRRPLAVAYLRALRTTEGAEDSGEIR